MYFLTRTGSLKENTSSEGYKKYYEATEGKESHQKFKELSDNFATKESLT